MATSPLAAAIETRRELINSLRESIRDSSGKTTTEEDQQIAEYVADQLIEQGWVRGRPDGEQS